MVIKINKLYDSSDYDELEESLFSEKPKKEYNSFFRKSKKFVYNKTKLPFWKIEEYVLKKYKNTSIDNAFSLFCKKVPFITYYSKLEQFFNLGRFPNKTDNCDEDFIIRFKNEPKEKTWRSKDYEYIEQYVINKHGIERIINKNDLNNYSDRMGYFKKGNFIYETRLEKIYDIIINPSYFAVNYRKVYTGKTITTVNKYPIIRTIITKKGESIDFSSKRAYKRSKINLIKRKSYKKIQMSEEEFRTIIFKNKFGKEREVLLQKENEILANYNKRIEAQNNETIERLGFDKNSFTTSTAEYRRLRYERKQL